MSPLRTGRYSFLGVPEALSLPESSCIVPHETVMWYMEQISRLGRPFAKFHDNFWIQSSQGKLFIDACRSEFSPWHRHLYVGKIPSCAFVKLTTEAHIMKIFISSRSDYDYSNKLDLISRRNVDALRAGRIAQGKIPEAIKEVDVQLAMRAKTITLPIEETATWQIFDKWKKLTGWK